MISKAQAFSIFEELFPPHVLEGQLKTYVEEIGVSKVGMVSPESPKAEHDDYCVLLFLREAPPKTIATSIPNEKGGVKIFLKVVGEIIKFPPLIPKK